MSANSRRPLASPTRLVAASLATLVLAAGCGDSHGAPAAADDVAVDGAADTSVDTAADTAADTSADVAADAPSPDVAADVPEADAPVEPCDEDCRTQDLTVRFGAVERPVSVAAYGLTPPAAAGEPTTLYLEAWEGRFDGCPTEQSPTPARTFILAGPEVDAGGHLQPTGELSATLLDYEGDLLTDGVFTRATAVEVMVRAATVCAGCVGAPSPSDPDGFVSLSVTVTFAEGVVEGGLYAIHCDSLDGP